MKTFLTKILFFIILFNNSFLNAEINIQAKTAIIQDYLSGKILYEKDPDIKIYPASMTKKSPLEIGRASCRERV